MNSAARQSLATTTSQLSLSETDLATKPTKKEIACLNNEGLLFETTKTNGAANMTAQIHQTIW
jgi:hypothetical protein